MTRALRHIVNTLLLIAMMTASYSLFADPVVIDSGADETVISRLPSAGEEEEPVCSDSTTGQLGKCREALLGFYYIEEYFELPEITTTPRDYQTICDEGDVAISAGYSYERTSPDVHVSGNGVIGVFSRNMYVRVAQASDGDRIHLSGMCADYAPPHVP